MQTRFIRYKRKVRCDGKVYDSIAELARVKGYTRQGIRNMLVGLVRNSLGVEYVE